jgi:hypothetical protein
LCILVVCTPSEISSAGYRAVRTMRWNLIGHCSLQPSVQLQECKGKPVIISSTQMTKFSLPGGITTVQCFYQYIYRIKDLSTQFQAFYVIFLPSVFFRWEYSLNELFVCSSLLSDL